MKHILLDSKTNENSIDLNLDLQDIKILYNACIDILDKHPEMISYKKVARKLKLVINNSLPL